MSDEEAESNSVSPVLKADWFNSRWDARTSAATAIS
jgi:hypothetical protein